MPKVVLRTGGLTCLTSQNVFIAVVRGSEAADMEAAFDAQRALIKECGSIIKVILVDASVPSQFGSRDRSGIVNGDIEANVLCCATAVIGAGFAASAGIAIASSVIRLRKARGRVPRILARSTEEIAAFVVQHLHSTTAFQFDQLLRQALQVSAATA